VDAVTRVPTILPPQSRRDEKIRRPGRASRSSVALLGDELRVVRKTHAGSGGLGRSATLARLGWEDVRIIRNSLKPLCRDCFLPGAHLDPEGVESPLNN